MAETVDMRGKVVLITGATNGLGKASALQIATMGATTVLAGRDAAKTDGVVKEIQAQSGNSNVSGLVADLSLMAEVRSLAAAFTERYGRLDVLMNNAGAGFSERKLTAEGIEQTFALNHLSYFLLTNLLLDRLKASAPARIVNVASDAHYPATMDLDDLQFERRSIGRAGFGLYGHSKLANILFTRELARRLEGSGVTATSVNPGMVATGIWGNTGGVFGWLIGTLGPLFMQSPAKGAATQVYLATSPEAEGVNGLYYSDSKAKAPSAAAQDDELARRLWDISAEMVGLPVSV